MTALNARDVEILKSEGRHYHAGALAAALGHSGAYGCHYGMRSTRGHAMAEFADGFEAATEAFADAAYMACGYRD